LTGIYYERSADPDHGTYTSGSGTPTTINTIVSQPNGLPTGTSHAVVTFGLTAFPALSTSALYAYDCRARVFYLTSGLIPTSPLNNMWTGAGSNVIGQGSSSTNDVGVGVVFNVGSLAPGESTTLRYGYVTRMAD